MQIRKVRSIKEVNNDIRNLVIKHDGITYSTDDLLQKKRLFLADYSYLDSLPLHRDFVFYSPQVLFFLNDTGSLELFAIHLRTNKTQQSHVMTKLSPPNKFLFAKMHAALADTQIHEFAHHLRIHLIMESIAIARNNYLGKYKLRYMPQSSWLQPTCVYKHILDCSLMAVVSGDIYGIGYEVRNIFQNNKKDVGYWLGPDNRPATFIINLGCTQTFSDINLVNTHNNHWRDRATKKFR